MRLLRERFAALMVMSCAACGGDRQVLLRKPWLREQQSARVAPARTALAHVLLPTTDSTTAMRTTLPLRSMSVSHPNCVTTYKLSMVRLLRGEGLMETDHSVQSVEAAAPGGPMAASPFGPAGGSSVFIAEAPRHVHSLLSGAEGVEVADPYGPLEPGLYETWMVLEVRVGRGGAREAGVRFGCALICLLQRRCTEDCKNADGMPTAHTACIPCPRPPHPPSALRPRLAGRRAGRAPPGGQGRPPSHGGWDEWRAQRLGLAAWRHFGRAACRQ